ncbi:copper-binding protein [Pseudomonas xionganensis]|uniref:RND transporter n=1 Tax=Pseudomonas xionganensis TaxID=2654845 RepID=A0A6I4KZ39_9PSED|nr:copper-binding protein [Pseudomonas xionganensis]MVW76062.1 RND transporter [Pseudomonas xionganensis]
MKKLLIAGLLGSCLSLSAHASDEHAGHHGAVQTEASMSQGEVRKVDMASGKVTLRHGPIANLGMPPMTMVFTAKDKSQLEGLAVGDKVQFAADKEGSQYVVTELKAAD